MAPPEHQRLDYPLADDVILDVGAYLGDFTRFALQRWRNGRFYAFEPCEEFFDKAHRTVVDPRAHFFCYGLGARTRRELLNVSNDSSSIFGTNPTSEIDIRDVVDVWRDLDLTEVGLMTINCEGGEYELLERMIETGLINSVWFLQVQFHGVTFGEGQSLHGDGPRDADQWRLSIVEDLKKTHRLQWEWPSVTWASWERR